MAPDTSTAQPTRLPLAPKAIGYLGLCLSGAGAIACVGLFATGAARGEGGLLLGSLLLAPAAVLAVWLFRDFLTLEDWHVAPDVPLGLKLLGHLGRVGGSVAAAGCGALAVMAAVLPDKPRPGLAALFVLGVFASLVVRLLGSAVSELRRWARAGALVATGLAVALLIVALALNLTTWRSGAATLPLALFLGLWGLLFLFLLVYFALPRVVEAFEADGL